MTGMLPIALPLLGLDGACITGWLWWHPQQAQNCALGTLAKERSLLAGLVEVGIVLDIAQAARRTVRDLPGRPHNQGEAFHITNDLQEMSGSSPAMTELIRCLTPYGPAI